MATQFYFKREWLEGHSEEDAFIEEILEQCTITDNGDCKIHSVFIVCTICSPIINRSLSPVLERLCFQIKKTKPIRGQFQTKIFILPFPYTDSRCRAKEFQTKP